MSLRVRDALSTVFGLSLLAQPAPAAELTRLATGAVVERELKSGETHRYEIELRAGEYFQAVVEQRGADVKVTIAGPDDRVALVADGPSPGEQGPEPLALVATATGPHEIAIEASPKGRIAPPGRYTLRIDAVRPPSDADLVRADAVRAMNEGCRLLEGPTPDARGAVEGLLEALAGWQDLGDDLMRMWVEYRIGFVKARLLDELGEAGDFYQRSLESARRRGDEFGEAFVLADLAENDRRLGRIEEAKQGLERALALHRAAGRRHGEARVLMGLGSVVALSGDLQQALGYFHGALRGYEEARNSRAHALVRMNIGSTYGALGEYDLALEQFRLAREGFGEDRRLQAMLATQLGDALSGQGDPVGARAAYEEALGTFKTLGNRVREASTSVKLGILERKAGRLEPARDAFGRAAEVFREGGDPLGEALARCELGETQRRLADRAGARAAFDAALKLSPEWHVWLRLCVEEGQARLSRDLGDLAGAREHAERALGIGESLRASVASQESRAVALSSSQPLYELLIDIRMRQHEADPRAGHDVAAFEIGERARARSLLELLAERPLDIRQGVDSALLAEERALRLRLQSRWEAQEQALGTNRKEKAETLGREIGESTARLREVEAQILHASPSYAALVRPQPLTLDAIRAQVLDSDTVLFEYALGDEKSTLWVVSKDGLTSHRLAARDEIERAARRVSELASAPTGADASGQTTWRTASEDLSRLILPAAIDGLVATRVLVVAPGALQYVPFAALPMPGGHGDLLLARYETVIAPSASVVATLREQVSGRGSATKSVAVLADPVFDASDPRVRAAGRASPPNATSAPAEPLERALRGVRGDRGLARLPFSRREADAIVALAPRGTSLEALGFDASRQTVTDAGLGDYRVVHFATHAVVNTRQPELSGVVLSLVDRQGRRQDGFLRLDDVYNLRLGADLAVLSACQTGLGKEVQGEGLVGLTRGFMYAGAPRVVASLWQVDDLATAELMKRFYRGMFEARLTPAAALRAAQRELAAGRRWSAPYYWAGFVLHGEWR